MTLPKYFDYQIQYTDNTARIVSWKQKEFEHVIHQWSNDDYKVTVVRDEAYALRDIRAIVKLKPLPVEKTTNDEKHPINGEYDAYDFATKQWLAEQGVDIIKGGMNG